MSMSIMYGVNQGNSSEKDFSKIHKMRGEGIAQW